MHAYTHSLSLGFIVCCLFLQATKLLEGSVQGHCIPSAQDSAWHMGGARFKYLSNEEMIEAETQGVAAELKRRLGSERRLPGGVGRT